MIDDAGFAFLFRLAFTLKITLSDVIALPRWEVEAWRSFFDVYGPLDWKRDDFRHAAILRQNCPEKLPLRDFIIFPDPSIKIDPAKEAAARETNLLRAFGYDPKNNANKGE